MQLIDKNQNHSNCSYVDKTWCAGNDIQLIILSKLSWHVVHSSNILTRYLRTSPMDNECGKHAATNSIYCPSHEAVHENTCFALSTVFWPCFSTSLHSYHFGSRLLYARLKNGTYYAVAMSVRLSVCPSVRPSVRPRFPDFSSTCFEISIWNLVYTFSRWHDMSSLSCITIGSFWPSLQPKVGQTHFLQSWPRKSR